MACDGRGWNAEHLRTFLGIEADEPMGTEHETHDGVWKLAQDGLWYFHEDED